MDGDAGIIRTPRGGAWSTRFVPVNVDIVDDAPNGGSVRVEAVDLDAQLALALVVEMLPSGLLRLSAELRNDGDDVYTVDALQLALPVPTRAEIVHDMAGRWGKEKVAQSRPFTVGSHLREGRHGRTGADAAAFLSAGTGDLDFAHGEVWGLHVAFSGNHRVLAERAFSGERLLLGGELLLPGEMPLAPGKSYATPPVYAGYGIGLDDVAARFHTYLRSRPAHPRTPRPVVMNVWEAVYFDHDLTRLLELADAARRVGVERFVLDDGWFGSRRDDTSGLGDWVIAEDVWGGGRFRALVDGVKQRGMQFGLWFEPEMVNVASELATAHPEWLLQVPGRLPVDFRHQQVLDLSHPGAFAHVRDQIVSLVREYGIDYIKWDHNRDLIEAGSTRTGRAGVHEQTLATYRLLDEIRAACPGLEIESCSSGAPASTSASSSTPTAYGRPTASTPVSVSRSSAGPPSSCLRSSWAATSAPTARTPPADASTSTSARPPPCSGTSASSGTSPPPPTRRSSGSPPGWPITKTCAGSSTRARPSAASSRAATSG